MGVIDGHTAQRTVGPATVQLGGPHNGIIQKTGGLSVTRLKVDLRRAAHLHRPADTHHCHPVGKRQRLSLVMGDQNGGDAGGTEPLRNGFAGDSAQPGIQREKGFVQ